TREGGRVRHHRYARPAGSGKTFEFRQTLTARKLFGRRANESLEFGQRQHHPPPSRARERRVGPPFDIRLTCIGWPLPQLGIAIKRRSLPTASTLVKKLFESAIMLPER